MSAAAVSLYCHILIEQQQQAWSSIVYALIPNVENLEHQLRQFCGVCEADEVVLFERATFLVISHANRKPHADVHRFEKISNIIKQFKLSCGKMGSMFTSMEVRNSRFSAFIDSLTPHTYVMVIISDPAIRTCDGWLRRAVFVWCHVARY